MSRDKATMLLIDKDLYYLSHDVAEIEVVIAEEMLSKTQDHEPISVQTEGG